ncbi:hypothetical protein, unlikely [Trypanosoma brucei brucei TREU927]|uniref:Uncharacterized protein n=1 Tax=Trypanosoma brucei brucei (strain 927/4 GUTat10.1) TaxID=185431 RepID=Q4GZC4_TRYB2|nr:hypothetical protein, unlikely [Trypanosoma brucei brucei TREU927]CAJ16018.1 hypothetical protein, unlikely [Trypanosoma brucei brucei TREU927]
MLIRTLSPSRVPETGMLLGYLHRTVRQPLIHQLGKKVALRPRRGQFGSIHPSQEQPAAGCDSKRRGMSILFLEHTAIVLTLRRFAAKTYPHVTAHSAVSPSHIHIRPLPCAPKKLSRDDRTTPTPWCALSPSPQLTTEILHFIGTRLVSATTKNVVGNPHRNIHQKKKKAGVVRDTTC